MLQGVGALELAIVGVVLLVLFGSQKIPQLAKGMGEALREFKKAAHETV